MPAVVHLCGDAFCMNEATHTFRQWQGPSRGAPRRICAAHVAKLEDAARELAAARGQTVEEVLAPLELKPIEDELPPYTYIIKEPG